MRKHHMQSETSVAVMPEMNHTFQNCDVLGPPSPNVDLACLTCMQGSLPSNYYSVRHQQAMTTSILTTAKSIEYLKDVY